MLELQFLSSTVEPIYKRFDCLMLVFAEYKRRALNQCSNNGNYRSGSIFCLYEQFNGEYGADHSAVKIEQFNVTLNHFAERDEIPLGDRSHFGVILWRNKIFVLGGRVNHEYLKSVRKTCSKLTLGEQAIYITLL